jgi:hypothetical protein
MMSRAVVRTVVSFMGYPSKMENDEVEADSKIGGSLKKVKDEVKTEVCAQRTETGMRAPPYHLLR